MPRKSKRPRKPGRAARPPVPGSQVKAHPGQADTRRAPDRHRRPTLRPMKRPGGSGNR